MTMPLYRCLVMDPPWPELGGGGRGAQNHYNVLHTSKMATTILRASKWNPAPDAHLWCWVTDNYLLDGLSLVDRLGFRYVRTYAWVKTRDDVGRVVTPKVQIGIGKYARGSHELCLFATRGRALLPDTAPSSVLFAPRTEHSRKPDEAFEQWFERVSPGPRLEMFARSARPGWDRWGFEAPTTNNQGSPDENRCVVQGPSE